MSDVRRVGLVRQVRNAMVCLVNQAIFLLKRQLERLEKDFLSEGGFTERLYRERSKARRR